MRILSRDYHAKISDDQLFLDDAKSVLDSGGLIRLKDVISQQEANDIVDYCSGLGRGSFPNYRPIDIHCPNFHRLNRIDARATIPGLFHQFSFFPWNQDIFDLFVRFRPIFYLKNKLSELSPDAFLDSWEDGVAPRISVQFYPKGGGFLARHSDPVGFHQIVVPTMLLTKKGSDYIEGGIRFKSCDEWIDIDSLIDVGDVVMFNADLPHEVSPIDPNDRPPWQSFEGRWMILFAMNKMASATHEFISSEHP